MSVAKCYSAQLIGLSTAIVTVEVDISNGLNSLSIVGLGDRSVEEARDRISAAIKNSGYASPKQKNQKVVISLAPADVKKEGPSFDLPMALAYLAAAGEAGIGLEGVLFFGELSLEGKVRRVTGLLPILCQAAALGFKAAYVPSANLGEASMAAGIDIYGVSSLSELLAGLQGLRPLLPVKGTLWSAAGTRRRQPRSMPDMRHIRGNETAKRGLEIAAAGGHNMLMYGPPGTGKTMLAQSFPSILPPLSIEHAIEVTGIHSAAGALVDELITDPPFRAPHHTASYPAIVGGGSFPRPGEITLAHRGVLFLDEFPEFDRSVLEALRQPLEERSITISRAKGSVTFPAQCILIASMNPCPCGNPKERGCTCTTGMLLAYRRRVSGPIMDRLDIAVNVDKVDYQKLSAERSSDERSADIRARVIAARTIQAQRFASHKSPKLFNSELAADDIDAIAAVESAARAVLVDASERLEASGRSFHRVIKVARTIADLEGSMSITETHVLEALQYRQKAAVRV
ncbi:MAG: YifB family Mg chelatase-like AAA ATPase [Patescibacteria group bacterium]|nr:YifB family Mg chelatase-like AAA ATPase [Patescibacteria group bacterium]